MATLSNVVRVLNQNKVILAGARANQAVCTFATSASKGQSPSSTPPESPAGATPPSNPTQETSTPTTAEVNDNKSYQTMEYYAHNEFSYYDIDANMSQDRIKQPSKYEKLVPQSEPPKK